MAGPSVSSTSPFAAVGANREIYSIIAYGLPLIIIFLAICKRAGTILGIGITFSLTDIIRVQNMSTSFFSLVSCIFSAIAFLMIMPAIANIEPFNYGEADSEICSGLISEYSGIQLGFIKLMKNVKIYVVTLLLYILFFSKLNVNTDNWAFDLIINTTTYILFTVVISLTYFPIIRNVMGRYSIKDLGKFYWSVPTAIALISYGLAWINI